LEEKTQKGKQNRNTISNYYPTNTHKNLDVVQTLEREKDRKENIDKNAKKIK